MSRNSKAYIAGVYEHPTRKAVEQTIPQLHAESARGALQDAGLTMADVDGYFCAGDAPGLGGLSMAEYMGLDVKYTDSTETGGSSYVVHVGHAVNAIAMGKCSVALITLAGRPRAEGQHQLRLRLLGRSRDPRGSSPRAYQGGGLGRADRQGRSSGPGRR